MLRKCNNGHGYYRGDLCPTCNEKGKFLMSDEELKRIGGIMSGILRHFPDQFGVMMDDNGWVSIIDLVDAIKTRKIGLHWLRPHHIEAIVETDEKHRYQVDGEMVRATYAHTIDVNLSDLPMAELNELYYPVTEDEVDIILEQGLTPTDRSKVHLSGSIQKATEAGQIRTENPIILQIDAGKAIKNGVSIRKAGKDVYISDDIDVKYISRLKGS
jgi:putative RNA 2'-phosphotransferase